MGLGFWQPIFISEAGCECHLSRYPPRETFSFRVAETLQGWKEHTADISVQLKVPVMAIVGYNCHTRI